jgi:hypothetical protein
MRPLDQFAVKIIQMLLLPAVSLAIHRINAAILLFEIVTP